MVRFQLRASLVLALFLLSAARPGQCRKTCVVKPGGNVHHDDAPAIIEAFDECSHRGRVVFLSTKYHVNSVMQIGRLEDVHIDVYGELLWSTDIEYWLQNSLEVGYQNQSTAFIIGGNRVRINGYGRGTFNGNGDAWYEFIDKQENKSNFPRRPHALTLNGLTNSVVKGMRFIRSQMWTLSMIYCRNVDLEDIFINNTGNVVGSCNTDIGIYDSECYDGSGIALGSIGQFREQFETMERLTVKNVHFGNTLHAVYFKTWTDDQNGYPPNGGGGGLGYCSDMVFSNLTVSSIRNAAVAISQCTQFTGAPGSGSCTDSRFQIRDVAFRGITGTTMSTRAASLQCSAVAPCTNLGIFDVNLTLSSGTAADEYLCGNVKNNVGFNCTGKPCEEPSGSGEC
ncbi:hypothetical protein ED733_001029 [Metarhizium rileyi]|uniref:Uncharacterized protein n=1 Tax=Metarhizium rileyi (strain RCEF 4871) TaxID=1649241 RepID=A0A5C6G8H5_METRR|nr:hypothetical protein ED733_001029 [Metarhizium rileyi]